MGHTAANLQAVLQRIERATAAAGRSSGSVRLLAVSKTWPAVCIEDAFNAGQRAFGENHEQEAMRKVTELAHLPIEWHFIGPVQSNKTRPIAEHFAWVHSLEREKVARRLAEQRPQEAAPLMVCVQVNVSGEATKSGVPPAQTAALARYVSSLPRLKLRGLMTVPAPNSDQAVQNRQFRRLHDLYLELRSQGIALDTLSMGMSDDLEAAIMEGATLVRVGTAIFGQRAPAQAGSGKIERMGH